MDISFKDYYQILGIGSKAAVDEIKSSFRRLAREAHPDATGDADNYERFILIREAYDILTNPGRRTKYDELYDEYHGAAPAPAGGDYMESVIKDFDVSSGSPYKDEWEFFVLHPDDYLSFFDSAVRLLAGSLFSVAGGILAPLAAFASILIISAISALIAGAFLAALVTVSLSSLAGAVIAIIISLRLRWIKNNIRRRFVEIFGAFIVCPLKGIPKEKGKSVLYFNYLLVYLAMIAFGYFAVHSYWSGANGDIAHWNLFSRDAIIMIGCICAAVAIFSNSIVLIFEIIQEALKNYPEVRYVKIKIKKGGEITYFKENTRSIGEQNTSS